MRVNWFVLAVSVAVAAQVAGEEPKYKGRTLSAWRLQLESSKTEDRYRALKALGALQAVSEVPRIARVLQDPKRRVRRRAVEVLSRLGVSGYQALISGLRTASTETRQQIVRHLWPNKDRPALHSASVKALLTCARSTGDVRLRSASIRALGSFAKSGAARPEALAGLLDALGRAPLQTPALRQLGVLGPAAKGALPAMRKLFESSSQPALLRVCARALLSVAGTEPVLVKSLSSSSPRSLASALALADSGALPDQVLPVLRKALSRDASNEVLEAVGKYGPAAVGLLPRLIELAPADQNAVEAIGKIGPRAAPAVPVLVRILEERGTSHQYLVIQALGRIGPKAKRATPLLVAAVKSADAYSLERLHAVEALGRIGARGAVPLLIAQFERGPRLQAAGALAMIGTPEEIEFLNEALASKDTLRRNHAAAGFGIAGKEAGRVLPILTGMLQGSWTTQALRGLAGLGPAAKSCLDRIRKIERTAWEGTTTGRITRALAREAIRRITTSRQ